MYRAFERDGGASWKCDAGAKFHLDSDRVKPTAKPGWTSADAAGLRPDAPGRIAENESPLLRLVGARIHRHRPELGGRGLRRCAIFHCQLRSKGLDSVFRFLVA